MPGAAAAEAGQDRAHDVVERHAAGQVELGGEADLRVHDAVLGEVLGALGGDPLEGLRRLHDTHGVCEPVEVQLQALAIGPAPEPRGELTGVGRRQADVAAVPGQLDHRLRAQPAVEVVVEEHLRRGADGRQVQVAAPVRLVHLATLR